MSSQSVDLTARGIIGRNNDGVVRAGGLAPRNRRDALLRIGDLGDTALPFQERHTFGDFATRQMLDGLQQLGGLSLAGDLVKLGRLHPCVDQLLEGLANFDTLMLPGISDEQRTVAGFQLGEEVAHLFGAGETGFIDHVQMAVAVRPAGANQEAL